MLRHSVLMLMSLSLVLMMTHHDTSDNVNISTECLMIIPGITACPI